MADVVLGRADLALFSDPVATQVQISHLMAAPYDVDRDRAFVRFVGDEFPTGFHGEGRSLSFALTALYARAEHAALLDLQTLLDELAPAAADQRLLLRTHYALVAGLDLTVAVELSGPLSITPSGAAVNVTFPVLVVQHTLAV